MTFLWSLTVLATLLALVAYGRARRIARKLEQLSQSYWELRYQHGQLRARVARLDPEQPPPAEPPAGVPAEAFVPLSAVKR